MADYGRDVPSLPYSKQRRAYRDLHRRVAQGSGDGVALPAPADRKGERPRQPLPRRLRRTPGFGPSRLCRGLCRDRRHRRRFQGESIRGEARRLQRDHGEGARRPAGGSLHRAAAPARAQGILGLRRGRKPLQRRPGRRKVPGHTARPRLSACPDHTEKGPLFALLSADEAGLTLTESYAMLPAASVSGFYLSHPDSRYFAVDKIGEDQAADYARRKALALEQTERWLAPNLAYEP